MQSNPEKSGSCQLTSSHTVTEGKRDRLTLALKWLPHKNIFYLQGFRCRACLLNSSNEKDYMGYTLTLYKKLIYIYMKILSKNKDFSLSFNLQNWP